MAGEPANGGASSAPALLSDGVDLGERAAAARAAAAERAAAEYL